MHQEGSCVISKGQCVADATGCFLSVLQAKEKVRNHLNTIDYSCSFTEGVDYCLPQSCSRTVIVTGNAHAAQILMSNPLTSVLVPAVDFCCWFQLLAYYVKCCYFSYEHSRTVL